MEPLPPPEPIDWSLTHSESGVDLTLLRWMLSLTPMQRLVVMERNARDTLKLLEYGRRHREREAATRASG